MAQQLLSEMPCRRIMPDTSISYSAAISDACEVKVMPKNEPVDPPPPFMSDDTFVVAFSKLKGTREERLTKIKAFVLQQSDIAAQKILASSAPEDREMTLAALTESRSTFADSIVQRLSLSDV